MHAQQLFRFVKKCRVKLISLHVSKEARQLKAWSQTKRSISSSNSAKSTRPQNDIKEDKSYPVTGNSTIKDMVLSSICEMKDS